MCDCTRSSILEATSCWDLETYVCLYSCVHACVTYKNKANHIHTKHKTFKLLRMTMYV